MGWVLTITALVLSIAYAGGRDPGVGVMAAVLFVGASIEWKLEEIRQAIAGQSK